MEQLFCRIFIVIVVDILNMKRSERTRACEADGRLGCQILRDGGQRAPPRPFRRGAFYVVSFVSGGNAPPDAHPAPFYLFLTLLPDLASV